MTALERVRRASTADDSAQPLVKQRLGLRRGHPKVWLAKGANLRILAMGIDTASPTGRLMLGILGSVAQFEREIMLERQREGIAKAKGEGKYRGRKPLDPAKAEEVLRLIKDEGLTPTKAAAKAGVARATAYRVLAGA